VELRLHGLSPAPTCSHFGEESRYKAAPGFAGQSVLGHLIAPDMPVLGPIALRVSQTARTGHRVTTFCGGGRMKTERCVARTAAVALVGCLTIVSSACGFIFSHAPPDGHEQMNSFSCTESNAGPIVDIVWAGLNVVGAVQAASDPDAYVNSSQIVAVGLSWGVVSSAAAAVGFNKSNRCRAAKRQLGERQARGLVAPVVSIPRGVVIAPSADTLRVGERVQLVATAHSSGGAVIPQSIFTWTSSNDAIASVNGAGLVTAHAAGSVVIAARAADVVGTASVLVLPPR